MPCSALVPLFTSRVFERNLNFWPATSAARVLGLFLGRARGGQRREPSMSGRVPQRLHPRLKAVNWRTGGALCRARRVCVRRELGNWPPLGNWSPSATAQTAGSITPMQSSSHSARQGMLTTFAMPRTAIQHARVDDLPGSNERARCYPRAPCCSARHGL